MADVQNLPDGTRVIRLPQHDRVKINNAIEEMQRHLRLLKVEVREQLVQVDDCGGAWESLSVLGGDLASIHHLIFPQGEGPLR